MVYCSRCGAPVPDGTSFCTHCGTPLAPVQSAPPQYQAPAAPRPPGQPRAGLPIAIPPAIAQIFTPIGLLPLIATIFCWIFWFELPGVTISALGVGQPSMSLWNGLGYSTNSSGTLDIGGGGHGIVSVILILCLLLPFAVPFLSQRYRFAKFLYAAPLLGFVLGWVTIDYAINEFNAITVQGNGSAAAGISTGFGVGAYFVALASLAAAAGVVTPGSSSIFASFSQLLARLAPRPAAGVPQPPPAYARPPQAHVPPPQVYAPPPAPAYAPPPPAHVAPPVHHAPPQAASGFCTSCGKPRTPGAQFCNGCGARYTA